MNHEVVKELERIHKEDGRLVPEHVIDRARDPSSPLHEQFEWDDSAAAEAYRLSQARRLIRSVRVEVKTYRTIITPKYVRNPEYDKGGSYVETLSLKRSNHDVNAIEREVALAVNALERAKRIAIALDLPCDRFELAIRDLRLVSEVAEAAE